MACLKFLSLAFATLLCPGCAVGCKSDNCAASEDEVSLMQLQKVIGKKSVSEAGPKFKKMERVVFKYTLGDVEIQFGGVGGVNKLMNRLDSDAYKFVKKKGLSMVVEESEFEIESGRKYYTYCLKIADTMKELKEMGFATQVQMEPMPEPDLLCNFAEETLMSAVEREKGLQLEQTQCPQSCHGYFIAPMHAYEGRLVKNSCEQLGATVGGCSETPEDYSKLAFRGVDDCRAVDCLSYTGERKEAEAPGKECRIVDGAPYTYGEIWSYYRKKDAEGKPFADSEAIKKMWADAYPSRCPTNRFVN